MPDFHVDSPGDHVKSDEEHDPAFESRIRERRTFSAATPIQLENERLGLLQAKEYARLSGDSDRESAVDEQIAGLGDRKLTDDSNPDVVSVGPSSYDVNSSYTVRPAQPDVNDGTIRADGDLPRGVAQPPDIVNIPNPGAHTAAVAARNAEKADSNRPASVGGAPVADQPADGSSRQAPPPSAGSKADKPK